MLLSLVDVIFADVAQPDQARIVAFNAQSFLKDQGHIIISIKASCIDSTVPPETIFAAEVEQLKKDSFKPLEQVTLEPYERDHAMVTGMSFSKSDQINLTDMMNLCSKIFPPQQANMRIQHILCTALNFFSTYIKLYVVQLLCFSMYLLLSNRVNISATP